MEVTALSVGKSVLEGALGYAKSVVAEEVALQLGVQRDHAFIRDELEMMQAFLMEVHEERDAQKVLMSWVKQVRDIAYDAEDCLQDFSVHLKKPSWWHLPRTLRERHHIAKKIKELRARVEDVSQRNMRYQFFKSSSLKPGIGSGQSSIASAEMSGIQETIRRENRAKVDLIRLIKKKDEDLRVIGVWGTNGVPEETSIIKRAYDDLKRNKKFECHAWIRIMHPFKLTEFLQKIVRQFFIDSLEEAAKTEQNSVPGPQDLRTMAMMKEEDLVDAFKKYVNDKSYLIVLDELSNMDEWGHIKTCFPNNKKGSRLIVCAQLVEVASLCVGPETVQPEHKQLSADELLYAFYEKVLQDGTYSSEPGPSSNTDIAIDRNNVVDGGRLTRMETMVAAFKESQLIGRENERSEIIQMISNNSSREFKVVSICGMGGLGKTTLVKYVYQSQELNAMFDKRACVTIKRPFDPKELLGSLATQLDDRKTEPGNQLQVAGLLEGISYLIVLDDLASTTEWDMVRQHFPTTVTTSRIIVTTREANIAKYCSKKDGNVYKLKFLCDEDAHNLFIEKVFGKVTDLAEQNLELAEESKLILKKCNGLPLAIVTIGGFLAKQPKTAMEWRKLNEQISAELEMNQELGTITDVLMKSYDGLPYHLKSCFLYLSIFPEDHNISRTRLVRRWIAEGYTSEVRGKSLEEITDGYFMGLVDRSMVLPSQKSVFSSKGIDACQVHDLMREISISKSMEENLVFRLEEGCKSNTQGTVRHLAISSNWKGDKSEFESVFDLSRVRSLTVFGEWRPFYISDKMRLLRVLDLEGTSGLVDHHLEHITKLFHLKYLSLRCCKDIFCLPDSLGNLRQLQTLDISETQIISLPKTITNLEKLQYLRARWFYTRMYIENPLRFLTLCAALCCAPKLITDLDRNKRDIWTMCSRHFIPALTRKPNLPGVVMPRGIGKLKELHTLGIVDIADEKEILQDIRRLTRLRKLAVQGINKRNCQEFCSILADDLSSLESLSLLSQEEGLHGCLDGVSSPPKNLQSLKLCGYLVKLPEWIGRLHNLVKLELWAVELHELDGTMQVLGKLPNLAILRLSHVFEGEELRLIFHQEAFSSLMALDLRFDDRIRSVEFEGGATPKLELLHFSGFDSETNAGFFSGIASLRSLKEVQLAGWSYRKAFVEDVRVQLAGNANRPVLKWYDMWQVLLN